MICPHCHKDTEVTSTGETQAAWFHQFWSAYWKKVSKGSASKAFRRHCKTEADLDKMLAAIVEQTPEMNRRITAHIPYPATWLNSLAWQDEQVSKAAVRRVIGCELCSDTGLVHVAERIVQGLRQDAHYERCSCFRGFLPGIVLPDTSAPF